MGSGHEQLTVPICREGTNVGDKNLEYVTIDVSGIRVGVEEKIERYVFDPYGRRFSGMSARFQPEIDLTSKMRVCFKEIVKFL